MRNRLLAAALAATAWLAGCAVAPYDSYPVYGDPVYAEPPPPRVEYPGYAPVVGYLWVGGYWTWTGRRYEWMPGRWEAPRPGYRWVEPRWQRDGQQWRQMRGGWQPEGRPPGMPTPAPVPRNERIDGPRGPVPGVRPQPAAPQPAPGYRRDIDNHPLPGPPDMGNRPPQRGAGHRQARRKRRCRRQASAILVPLRSRRSRRCVGLLRPSRPPSARRVRPGRRRKGNRRKGHARKASRGEPGRGERRDDSNSGTHSQGGDR